ncbi:MAG TPA: hypothetical protein PLY79_11275 [Ferruginibacter sp.]|nr:hypothetical protein [Ferruginibacter sp.]
MPDRIVRANILTSDLVNQLSWPAEVFYRRLMSVVDDYGRFEGRVSILRASLYPLKLNQVSEADIVKWKNECSEAGLISLYEVESKEYLVILKFNQRLRAAKSKYPPPSDTRGHPRADDSKCCQPLSNATESDTETETESETESGNVNPRAENFNEQGMIHRSNLYRKPNVPEFDKVHECFVARGGTKEMADAFFRKHSAFEWYLNGTPIMNFVHLVPSFIDNWRRNEVKGNKNQENKDYNERLAEIRKQQEDEAWAAINGNNASK